MSSQQSICSAVHKEKPQYLHAVIGIVITVVLIFGLQYVLNESMLISLAIFNLIFLLTFLLNGPLWCKILWLLLGNVVGVSFCLIRLSFSLILKTDFYVIDFFLNYVIDFLWVVPIWSLALSSLCMKKNRKKSIEGL